MDKQLTGKEFRIMDLEQKIQELERDRNNLNDAFENQGADFINLKSSFHETQESQNVNEKKLKNLDCEINLMRYELQGCREQMEQKEDEIDKINQMLENQEQQIQFKNEEIEQLESRTFIDQHADYIYNMSNKYIFKKS